MTLGLFDFRSYGSLQKPVLKVWASAASGSCSLLQVFPAQEADKGLQSKCKETHTQIKDASGRQATVFVEPCLFISADRTDFDAVLICKWRIKKPTAHLFPPHLASCLSSPALWLISWATQLMILSVFLPPLDRRHTCLSNEASILTTFYIVSTTMYSSGCFSNALC